MYVNLLRLIFAGVLLAIIGSGYVQFHGGFTLFLMPWRAFIWFMLSGVFGLVIGDIFYLSALTTLGPRRTTQLFILSPIVPVAIAWTMMGERLTLPVLAGIAMILSGIAYTNSHESRTPQEASAEPGRYSLKGYLIGITASIFQGLGAVMGRQAFLSAPDVDPIVATVVRVGCASVVFCIIALFMGMFAESFRRIRQPGVALRVTVGAITGPVVGMLFYVSALKYAYAGVVTTLSSLSPLLILPIIAFHYRVKIRKEAIFGTVFALAGVAIMALVK